MAPSAFVATSMRGPGILPDAMRVAQADVDEVAAPRSRTVVKPAIRVRRTISTASSVRSGDGLLQNVQFGVPVVAVERHGDVRVRVHEAGEQRGVAQIDHLRRRLE